MESPPTLLDVILAWIPVIMFVGLGIYLMRSSLAYCQQSVQLTEDSLSEMKRNNETLEKILKNQEKQLQLLEKNSGKRI